MDANICQKQADLRNKTQIRSPLWAMDIRTSTSSYSPAYQRTEQITGKESIDIDVIP